MRLPPMYNIVRFGDSFCRAYGGVCVQEEQKQDRNCSSYSLGAGAAISIVWSTTVAWGEDAAAYDQLLARICAAVKPVDIVEEIFTAD
jgi:hypothetical protein